MQKVISLTKCKSQKDIADWAIGAMEALPDEEQEELWGMVYDNCPIEIKGDFLFIEANEEVAKDFLYRIEEQYMQMANDESRDEYKKALPVVMALANKVRQQYELDLVDRSDLVIHEI